MRNHASHSRILRLAFIPAAALAAAAAPLQADDWPQWLGPKRDAVWRETGIVERFPASGLQAVWRTPVSSGYTGPAVAGGRVYVMDRVRAAAAADPGSAFQRGDAPSKERVLCLDERTGAVLWQHEYDCRYTVSYPAGPRATPTVADGKVYTLGAEGHLRCLDAASGKLVWSRHFKTDFGAGTPMWGFAGHPLIDGRRLFCMAGGKGSLAVALDKDSGEVLWRALDAKEPGYSAPMIFQGGGPQQLIVWHPESLNSLDPETGRLFWSQPFESRVGLSVAMPRQLGDRLFVTAFYNGPLMMRVQGEPPAASVLWKGKSSSEVKTDGLHSIIPTPFLEDNHIYGVCSYGQLRCLKADTGERVWSTLQATTADGKETRWGNAFLVKHGSRFFLANEKGELILARLSPAGYEEISRAKLVEPTNRDPGRLVVWSHPAFANKRVYARNDRELVCFSLAAE